MKTSNKVIPIILFIIILAIIIIVLSCCYGDLKHCNIIVANIILNFGLYLFLQRKCCAHLKSQLFPSQLNQQCSKIKFEVEYKQLSIILIFFKLFVLWLRNLSDFPYNIIKLNSSYNKQNKPVFSKCMCNFYSVSEMLYVFYLGLGIFIYVKFPCCLDLFSSFFAWRIINITLVRLDEITSSDNLFSFQRTLILFIFNLVELVIGYAYLYIVNDVFEGGLSSIFNTISILNQMTTNDRFNLLCSAQQWLVISQIAVFFISFYVFFANIGLLKFQARK